MTIQTTPRTAPAAHTGEAPSLRKYLIGGGALIVVLAGFYYWSHSGGAIGTRRTPPVPVQVSRAQQLDMPVVKNALGTVVANTTVSVTARVQGQLTKAYFKEGQMVKQANLLFQIDPSPFQAAYDATLATL